VTDLTDTTDDTTTRRRYGLADVARPSGGFAMLAVDQREAMRAMFAEHQTAPVTDAQLTDFKVAATRVLTPFASAVLVDKQFAFDAEVDPAAVREQGAVAMKLLVIHRPDEAASGRIEMVEEFVDRCRAAGLVSIIEPVAKAPRAGGAWDAEACIIEAAQELGSLGADLYKAEVPYKGQGTEEQIRRACAQITEAVSSPWVVLSSGVPAELFPRSVELACREGASGFLAGRAVWASVIGSDDVERDLHEVSIPRLQRLGEIVDEVVQR